MKKLILVFVIILIALVIYLFTRAPDLSVAVKQTPQGELLVVIKEPVIRGLSGGGHGFEITALAAERAALAAADTKLIGISGKLNAASLAADAAASGEQWVLAAPSGIYNQLAGTLFLQGETESETESEESEAGETKKQRGIINLTNQAGTIIDLFELHIDIKNSSAFSDQQIKMQAPEGDVVAASFQADYEEGIFHFSLADIKLPAPKNEPKNETKNEQVAAAAIAAEDSFLNPLRGQFITDPTAPITARAHDIYINRKTETIDFVGDAITDVPTSLRQAGLLVEAGRMRLTYGKDAAGETLLEHLTAHSEERGQRVQIKSENGRQASALTAHYIFADNVLILRGSVELISEPETEQVERLYGETLTINMATGVSKLEGGNASTERVRIELNTQE